MQIDKNAIFTKFKTLCFSVSAIRYDSKIVVDIFTVLLFVSSCDIPAKLQDFSSYAVFVTNFILKSDKFIFTDNYLFKNSEIR